MEETNNDKHNINRGEKAKTARTFLKEDGAQEIGVQQKQSWLFLAAPNLKHPSLTKEAAGLTTWNDDSPSSASQRNM